MADLVSVLDAWRDQVERRDFIWGLWDCLLAPADYALALTGSDPAAAWRGRYVDERGARRILREAGGMPAFVGQALEPLGWRPTDAPAAGAIGVVRLAGGLPGATSRRTYGGVLYGDRWLIASGAGGLYDRARPVASWNVPEAVTHG